MQAQLYQESKPLWEPSKKCQKSKKEILDKWGSCFKEKLGKNDTMDHPPIKLKLKKDKDIKPSFCTTMYNVRAGDKKLHRSRANCSIWYWAFRKGIKSVSCFKRGWDNGENRIRFQATKSGNRKSKLAYRGLISVIMAYGPRSSILCNLGSNLWVSSKQCWWGKPESTVHHHNHEPL